jgi:hypothetical protein
MLQLESVEPAVQVFIKEVIAKQVLFRAQPKAALLDITMMDKPVLNATTANLGTFYSLENAN